MSVDTKGIIVIVDDCSMNRLLTKTILQKADPNLQIVECVNGKEGLEKIQEILSNNGKILCIIMDFDMPIMDGDTSMTKICEFTKQINGKSLKQLESIKAIMLTANVNYKGKTKPCEGCNGCARIVMYKPVSKSALIAAIGL